MAITNHPAGSLRAGLLGAAAVLLFLVVLAAMSWRLREHWPVAGTVSLERWGLASYRDVIYFPLIALGDHVNPYDSTRDGDPTRYMERYPVADHLPLYSPLALLVFSPLALFPVDVSMIAFAALDAFLILLLAWATLKVVALRTSVAAVFGLGALLLATQPGRGSFNAGQIAVPLALAILGALEWSGRSRWRAAACVALSTMKPTFGGPFGVLLAARRDWKSTFAGLTIGGLAFCLGLLAIFAWTGDLSVERARQVLGGNYGHLASDPEAIPKTNKARTDLPAVFEYLTGQPAPGLAAMAISAAIVFVTFVLLWRTRTAPQAESAASAASALIIVTIFVCIFHNVYDLPLLVVPIAACATAADASWKKLPSVWRRLVLVLLLVPFVNIFWTSGFGSLLEEVGGSWGESGRSVLTWTYRLSCAANGLSLAAVWLILVVFIATCSRRSGCVAAASATS